MKNITSWSGMVLLFLGAMNLVVQPVSAGTVTNGFDTDDIYVLRNGPCEANVQILDETMLDGPPPYATGMDKGILWSGTPLGGEYPDAKAICTRRRKYGQGQDNSKIKSLCFSNSPVPGTNTPAGARLFGVYDVRSFGDVSGERTYFTASFQIVELDSTGKRIRVLQAGLAASQFYGNPRPELNNVDPDLLTAPRWGIPCEESWVFTRNNYGGCRSGTIRYNPAKNTLMVAIILGDFDTGQRHVPPEYNEAGREANPKGMVYEFALPDWPEVYYQNEAQVPPSDNPADMVGQPIPQSDPTVVKLVQVYEMPYPHNVSANNGQVWNTNTRPAIDFDSNGNMYFTSKFFNATTPPNWGAGGWVGSGLTHGDVVKCSTLGKIGGRTKYIVPLTDDPNTPEDESTNLVIQRANQDAIWGTEGYAGGSSLVVRGDTLVLCPRNGNNNQSCNYLPPPDPINPPNYWINFYDLTNTHPGYVNELLFIKRLDSARCDWPRNGSNFMQLDEDSNRVFLTNIGGACDCPQNLMCIQSDDTLAHDLGYYLSESCNYPGLGSCVRHYGDNSCVLRKVHADAASPPPPPEPEPTGACCTGTPCNNCVEVPLSQCDPLNWLGAGTTCEDYGHMCPQSCGNPTMDGDCDGDVDQGDFALFQRCYSGNNNNYPIGMNCDCFDKGNDSPDNDIDSLDFDAFQSCASGPNVPTDCSSAACGDGDLDPGEECDHAGESATCDADCTVAECGDATLNTTAGEECDHAGESATCDDDCTWSVCGDLTLNELACEDCDDGNTDNGDGCDASCYLEVCGNHVVQPWIGEECDDGNID
ncbi:MAG: hypothetical protein ACYTBZ_09375, partial [Planctomycetota bacterium]